MHKNAVLVLLCNDQQQLSHPATLREQIVHLRNISIIRVIYWQTFVQSVLQIDSYSLSSSLNSTLNRFLKLYFNRDIASAAILARIKLVVRSSDCVDAGTSSNMAVHGWVIFGAELRQARQRLHDIQDVKKYTNLAMGMCRHA